MLDLSIRELERILYYENYAMIDPGILVQKGDVLTEEEYAELEEPGKSSMLAWAPRPSSNCSRY